MAVMIGPPNVDTAVKTTLSKFVAMIGDVRRKISGVAILADQDFILFRAEGGSAIPEGAFLVIGQALVL